MDIFLTKMHQFATGGLQYIHPPEPCEGRFIMDVRALFDYFWTAEKKKHTYSHSKAWKSKDNF